MSDYISKKALLKHLWDWRLQECPVGVCDEETETYKTICECIKAVEEQPTVDEKEIIRKPMERIIERLKGKKKTLCGTYDFYTKPLDRPSCKIAFNNGICESIEVVKEEGGIE